MYWTGWLGFILTMSRVLYKRANSMPTGTNGMPGYWNGNPRYSPYALYNTSQVGPFKMTCNNSILGILIISCLVIRSYHSKMSCPKSTWCTFVCLKCLTIGPYGTYYLLIKMLCIGQCGMYFHSKHGNIRNITGVIPVKVFQMNYVWLFCHIILEIFQIQQDIYKKV